VKAEGGVIDLSQRKLARKLGASRTTLQRALGALARRALWCSTRARPGRGWS
jgi:DNA-binding GntR family transcriptional regulator